MALSMTHQIGSMAGAAMESSFNNGDSTAAVVIKSPGTSLKCKAMRTDGVEGLSPPMSPCMTTDARAVRADLSAVCKALATEVEVAEEKEHAEGGKKGEGSGVPVFVMMPLDSVTAGNTVNRRKAVNAAMAALKSAGVEGVMMDVWWGLVEREKPGEYNWGGYVELMEMAKKHGLKVQAVMSFHQCGGNVGDSCT